MKLCTPVELAIAQPFVNVIESMAFPNRNRFREKTLTMFAQKSSLASMIEESICLVCMKTSSNINRAIDLIVVPKELSVPNLTYSLCRRAFSPRKVSQQSKDDQGQQ